MVAGCDRPHKARGLCHPHWKRWRRTVDALPDSELPPTALTVADIAARASVAVGTVYNWVSLGRLPLPDGSASGRSWWWPGSVEGITRRKAR